MPPEIPFSSDVYPDISYLLLTHLERLTGEILTSSPGQALADDIVGGGLVGSWGSANILPRLASKSRLAEADIDYFLVVKPGTPEAIGKHFHEYLKNLLSGPASEIMVGAHEVKLKLCDFTNPAASNQCFLEELSVENATHMLTSLLKRGKYTKIASYFRPMFLLRQNPTTQAELILEHLRQVFCQDPNEWFAHCIGLCEAWLDSTAPKPKHYGITRIPQSQMETVGNKLLSRRANPDTPFTKAIVSTAADEYWAQKLVEELKSPDRILARRISYRTLYF